MYFTRTALATAVPIISTSRARYSLDFLNEWVGQHHSMIRVPGWGFAGVKDIIIIILFAQNSVF